MLTKRGLCFAAGWASQYDVFNCANCPEQARQLKGCTLPGFEATQPAPPITIGGKPWTGCPGSLSQRLAVSQARRWAWHTEGRFGAAVATANPVLLDRVEAYVSGQMAARAAQHRQEMERLTNG